MKSSPITERDVAITTADGSCDAHFAYPAEGRYPAVLVWPDFVSLRGCFRDMARRLAENGYAVLTVNPYYRRERAPVLSEGVALADPGVRERLVELVRTITPAMVASDADSFVSWLDADPSTDPALAMGVSGYCMGGGFAVRTAETRRDRIGAVVSFHGSRLVTADSDSPHHLIGRTKAVYLFAIARNDDASDPTTKDALCAALSGASRPSEIEVYPADHGWCVADSAAFEAQQAALAWQRQLAMFHLALV